MARIYKTPGVYIEERSAFPNSAVPVPTAVPAFIGYTENAIRDKKSLILKPTKISSYGEYLQFFGGAPKTKVTVTGTGDPTLPYDIAITESYFTLHNQMKMFFSNGGTDCYIVSVGKYVDDDGAPVTVNLEELKKGIAPLLKEQEPTMLVIPDAAIAPVDPADQENAVKAIYTLYQDMLKHCGVDMQSRFAITDVWMDRAKYDTDDYDMQADVKLFRNGIGTNNLQWGATYFPWLHTSAIAPDEITLLNIAEFGAEGDVRPFPDGTFNDKNEIIDKAAFKSSLIDGAATTLAGLLDTALNQDVYDGVLKHSAATDIKNSLLIGTDDEPGLLKLDRNNADDVKRVNQGLTSVSSMFKAVLRDVRKELNLLPPSATMAGIYSMIDNTVGVFQSPANVSVGSVMNPAVNISADQQESLNVPINGKAVNAIRSFPGKGVLVWGARTLDGNSQDWRYISVRRTVIFIEQSIKFAAEPYVFEPNTAATWSNMKALIVNFLTNVWQSGALAGATAEDAFSVDVGLGSTMTPVDILDGYMRISVKIAVTRPAEFIVITFEQKMQQS
ncbi:phage tail sheath C-terminal domain-containing protein [Lewinella sp. W8]|uniref:phage tail sheath family protein n=1 Tax=Lewinella sp. W8 TaxID=2528208 RepID=UPI00106887C8|nr:phage tail sheath C-terminal domain-containing protein [Lewinella sp. W8]MTB52940.1 phage tail sheath family protein [Lewinella sp. W8]